MKVKTLKRFTAIALSLICIVLSLPLYTSAADGDTASSAAAALSAADVPALLDLAEAAANGHIRRLYEEETDLYTAVFENADGSKTVYTFGEPIKYVAQSGEIRDKKTALTSSENGFTAADNDVVVSVPGSVSGTAAITHGGNTVTITPKDRAGMTAPAVLMSDNTVRFSEPLFAANSLSYTALPSGISSDIILNRYDGEYIFAFDIGVGALTVAAAENGIYSVADANGTPLFNFGDVVFTDSAGNYSFAELEFEPDGDGHYSLKVIADLDFLQSEDTVYPLAASVTVSSSVAGSAIKSINLYNKSFSDNPEYIYVGDRGIETTTNHVMSYGVMTFPGLAGNMQYAMVDENDIISFKLNLYCIRNCALGMMYTDFRAISGYTNGIVSYANLQINDTIAPVYADMGNNGEYNEVDLTVFSKYWKTDRNALKNGLVLTCGGVEGYFKKYGSPACSTSGKRPYYSLTYANERSMPQNPNTNIVPGALYRFVNVKTGQVLSSANGLQAVDSIDLNDDNQVFRISYYGKNEHLDIQGGSYYIQTLDNRFFTSNTGGPISLRSIIAGPGPDSSNLWYIISMPDGSFRFQSMRFSACSLVFNEYNSYLFNDNGDNSEIGNWRLVPHQLWYSQLNATGNWNAAGLDNVYFGSKDSQPVMNGTNNCLMRQGCFAASAAMILRNLGATMYGYDVRNSDAGMHQMQADPFTVLMANCKTNGAERSVADGKIVLAKNISRDANDIRAEDIYPYFGVKLKKLEGLTGNGVNNKALIRRFLLENPQGISVSFKKSGVYGNFHAMVFIGITHDINGNECFIACDPGVSSETYGRFITFTETDVYKFEWVHNVNTYQP